MAIAITLLALDLKLTRHSANELLVFSGLLPLVAQLVAFFLSFVVIAVVWSTHYQFFQYIVKIDAIIIRANLVLLVFVVLLPFSASLLSDYFNQKISTLIYAANFLSLTLCVNFTWLYLSKHPDYLKHKAEDESAFQSIRISCKVGVINGVLAVISACVFPLAAFCMLLLRPLTTLLVKVYYESRL